MPKRIAIGVIGCGFFAQNLLYAWTDLRAEGADLTAVCDIDAAKAKAAGEKFGVPWYPDASQMLDKHQLGLVDIVTQVRTHLMLAELTMARRIPTVVQKPFGQTIEEVRRMVELGREAQTFLAVHENFRFQLPMLKVKEILSSGAIGTPNWGRISFRTGYDIYAGQPYLATERRFVLMDLGVHVLDLARFFLGEVEHVTAELQKRNPKVAGEDTATLLLRHKSGAVSIVECTYQAKRIPDPFPETLLEIEGDKGALVTQAGARIEVMSEGKVTHIDADPIVLPWAERPWHVAQDSVVVTNRHMLQALQAGRDADTSAADNLKTFALVEAAYVATGKVRP